MIGVGDGEQRSSKEESTKIAINFLVKCRRAMEDPKNFEPRLISPAQFLSNLYVNAVTMPEKEVA